MIAVEVLSERCRRVRNIIQLEWESLLEEFSKACLRIMKEVHHMFFM